MVRTTARSKKERRKPPIEIAYALHQVEGKWRVFDVVTDGVSMVRNYRGQFARILRKDGWDGLLQRMRDRLDQGSEF